MLGELEHYPAVRARYSTTIRSSTAVTPGADQTAAIASSCSAHDFTVPARITIPLDPVSTERPPASSLALRRKALLIPLSMSCSAGGVVSVMWFRISSTPGTLAVRNSASSRWYCQSAVPVRVTRPARTLASTVIGIRQSSISAASTSPRNSVSSRSLLSGV